MTTGPDPARGHERVPEQDSDTADPTRAAAAPDAPVPDATAPDTVDPTRIREQPTLTTSSGTIWLIVGGLFTAIALAVLIPMTALPNGVFALVAAIIAGAVYLGMIVTRLIVPPGRRRLGMLATGMLVIAGVSLVAATIVATAAVPSG